MADKLPTSEIEAQVMRQEAAAAPLADVLGQLAGEEGLAKGLGSGWAVSRAWLAANGSIERNATCGVYSDERAGRRRLTVYVDTRGHMVDFNANREVYLARMAAAGFDFDEIRFALSKRPKAAAGEKKPEVAELPELDAAEEARAAELAAGAPEALRGAVLAAIRATMRGEKARG